ncbi:Rid family hydrolase [Roseobacteraceae bacterium S113]
MIDRVRGEAPGRVLARAHAGLVYAVAYDPLPADGIEAQTRNALAFLDNTLADLGADRGGLLQVTVYLAHMSDKAAMDAVFLNWIGPEENWPQRACIGVDLGSRGDLIEIVVIAAQTPQT